MTQGFMTNSQGHLVPMDKVKSEDVLENDLVSELYSEAVSLNKQLQELKDKAFSDVSEFVELLSEKYGVSKGGRKGNLTLTSFDGLTKIQIAVADKLQFGAQLQVAKQLIDECINDWADGVNNNIKALVDHAFRVDKAGRINVQSILGLRRLNITDEKWLKAMDAITDSIRVTSTKQYVRFYRRESQEAEFETVNLDIARV
ncbi:MAG: sulfate transporter [Rickettsiales bacterium]|nr:sulfate transporter [Rickettsiales bacterium]|tara:strand:+ start:38 stop:640 length:603 start_codon:yes stop_codon:yes gene_type:complete